MNRKRLKTLNLCDNSVAVLNDEPNGSHFARRAILMHRDLIRQQVRDDLLVALLSNVIREVYLYPNEATERIEQMLQINDEMREWYRKDELEGNGERWIIQRGRAVAAGVRL